MTDKSYQLFLESKRLIVQPAGIDVPADALNPHLFAWQASIVQWALRKGRAALFTTTGTGKTAMQCEWARIVHEQVGVDVLILAPLAVAQQTIAEAAKFGITVNLCRSQADVRPGLNITNYDRLHLFTPSAFGAVVLDESSILKSFEGKTRTALIAAFASAPYRLCATATPAPNDIAELANHAEFLGLMSRTEMLASFFVHDDDGWRLKGHARHPFYRWLASWSMSLRRPSDLGYSDDGFDLPPLDILPVIVRTDYAPPDRLFFLGLKGVGDRVAVRRTTLDARVRATVERIAAEPDRPWLVWCGLNDEQGALAAALGDRAISVYGALPNDEKERRLFAWMSGDRPILLSKVTIAGFGMNFQHCARMVFCGLSDSYEQYFQAVRRCWRYGQTERVQAYIVLADVEEEIHTNVLAKECEAETLAAELVRHVTAFEQAEIGHVSQRMDYRPTQPIRIPSWLQGAA